MSFFRQNLQISTDPNPIVHPPDMLAYKNGSQQSFLSRLQMLQSNLARVTNQHQALLHLLSLVQLLPQIQRNLQQSHQVKSRLQSLSQNMTQFHGALKQNINHGAISSLDSNFKSLNSQVQELKQRLKEVEGEQQANSKQISGRVKEEAAQIVRNVEMKVHNGRADVGQFVAEMRARGRGVGEEGVGVGASQVTEAGLFGQEREYYDNEVNNIKREIGLLQCEMEYLMDLERTAKIRNSIKMLGNLTANEKNFSIGYLQQQLFLEQFESFQQSNSNRLKYELQLISNNLQRLPTCISTSKPSPKLKNQLTYLQDRQFSVLSQLKGSQLKKSLQLKRLDNRMHKIDQLSSQLTLTQRQTLQPKLHQVQLLKSKLKHNRKMLQGNQSLLSSHLDEIGRKISSIRKLLA